MRSKKSIFILFLVCSFFFAQSQETRKALPLKQVLQKIAVQHQISFNYIEDEIAVFSLVEPAENLPLNEKIAYIQKETNSILVW